MWADFTVQIHVVYSGLVVGYMLLLLLLLLCVLPLIVMFKMMCDSEVCLFVFQCRELLDELPTDLCAKRGVDFHGMLSKVPPVLTNHFGQQPFSYNLKMTGVLILT